MQDFAWIKQAGVDLARSLLEDEDCIAALKAAKYDLILRDPVGWHTHLLSKMLDVPEVVCSPEPGSKLRGLKAMQGPTFPSNICLHLKFQFQFSLPSDARLWLVWVYQ